MSTKITMVFVVAVIALASPALAAGNGNRDNGTTPLNTAYRRMTFRVRKASTASALAGHCQVDKVLTILRVGPNC